MDDRISPEQSENPVKWFELFYDLVIVAAVVTFSDALSARPTVGNLLWVTFAFAMIWLVWFATTFRFNHDRRDEAVDRLIVVIQMAALSVGAIAIGEGPGEERPLVAASFGVVVLTLAALSWRSGTLPSDSSTFFRVRAAVLLFAAVCILASALTPDGWYFWLWGVAAIAFLAFRVVRHAGPGWQVPPVDVRHLTERFGLLTIVVLGESFVKLAIVASGDEVSRLDIEVGIAMFVCVFGVFWAYFDDVPLAGIAGTSPRRFALFGGHFVLQTGCIGLAIGLAYLTTSTSVTVGWRAAALASGSVVLVYLGFALLGPGTCRAPIAPLTALRLATAGIALLVLAAIPFLGDVDANVIAYAMAVLILAHGAAAQYLVNRSSVEAPPTPAGV